MADEKIPTRTGHRRHRVPRSGGRRRVCFAGLVTAAAVTLSVVSGGAGAQAATLSPPAVPSTGAYLGAFVAPHQAQAQSQSDIRIELSELGNFDGVIGRPLGLVHVFQNWKNPVRTSGLAALASTGATPVVDWTCTVDADVIDGSQDSLITSYAQSLKKYGRPVFLRWFWEMNLVGGSRAQACLGTLGSTGYIEAWQHIWTIFRQVGASNVAFVWCPSIVSPDFAVPYYPGDQYVDWIGVDGYDRQQDPAAVIAELLPFYQHWMADGKPMMIGETGATTDQASYLADLASTLPVTFPGIKALLYYDSRSSSDWTLVDRPGDLGLDQFIATGQLAYFSFPFISS